MDRQEIPEEKKRNAEQMQEKCVKEMRWPGGSAGKMQSKCKNNAQKMRGARKMQNKCKNNAEQMQESFSPGSHL